MNDLKAVIIDDMPQAIKSARTVLQDVAPDTKVIGTASNVKDGAELIQRLKPDIALLDIEMPDGTGFDLIDLLPDDINTHIIFITGSEEYAIRAFRYAAVDYLLKPIDSDDLLEALNKTGRHIPSTSDLKRVWSDRGQNGVPERIALHTAESIDVVNVHDIVRCQSMDNYCVVHLIDGNNILISKPLKHFDELLTPAGFLRTHQSHLVNVAHIQRFVKRDGGYLELKDESRIPVSIRRRVDVINRII